MKKFYYSLFLLFSMCIMSISAQVTIGADTVPQDFSVLELISNSSKAGGLRMPRMTEGKRTDLTNSVAFQAEKEGKAMGLTIYNLTSDCIEFWNGTKWVSRCRNQGCCMAPDSPCPVTFNFSKMPLWLDDTFTAEIVPVAGLTYQWTVSSSMEIVGAATGSSVTIQTKTAGNHLLSGVNVTATNDCGSSGVCAGNGTVRVLDCNKIPEVSDVNLTNIKVEGADSGTGTGIDPYIVTMGNTIKITYQNPEPSIYYMWSLNAEGQNYFDLVASNDSIIELRAKNYNVNGAACGPGAIRLSLYNDCGMLLDQESGIQVKIYNCNVPNTPQIQAPASVYEGETFTVSVTAVSGENYIWSLSNALKSQVDSITGGDTHTITLRNKVTAGNSIDLSGLSVTAENSCGTATTTGSGTIGVLVIPSVTGAGILSGKTCFDIAYSNNNSTSGFIDNEREYQQTDFDIRTAQDQEAGTTQADYSGVQVYTFTTSGVASNVRFVINDPNGAVINYVPAADYSGSLADGTKCKLTVYYDPDLNTRLQGLTRANAQEVDIYAIYNDGVSDKAVKLTTSLRDASCCGAATTTGSWLVFMCHNLGVDQSLDPMAENTNLYGDIYQWGRPKDGHENRNSTTVTTLSLNEQATNPSSIIGNFIVATSSLYFDWMEGNTSGATNNPGLARWGNATEDLNPPKAANDPCPAGWKVPSQKNWGSIFLGNMQYNATTAYANNTNTANKWEWKSAGVQIGNELYLPAAGFRPVSSTQNGTWESGGSVGRYWSATVIISNANVYKLASLLFFNNSLAAENANSYRSYGLSVRCVADDRYTPAP